MGDSVSNLEKSVRNHMSKVASEMDQMSRRDSGSSSKSGMSRGGNKPVKIVNGLPVLKDNLSPVLRKPTDSSHEFDAGSNGTSYKQLFGANL